MSPSDRDTAEPKDRPRVILVDDERDSRELLRMTLEDAGFEVAEASNGLRLISILHVDRPDVILLDVRMSWIDGFELCRSIKKNEEFRSIPVVFVSALATPEAIREGLDAGAVDYFAKPIDIDRLLARLRELTRTVRE